MVLTEVDGILLDIEGTTTPMEFVHTTLFDYAKKRVRSFLIQHEHNPEVRKIIDDLRTMRSEDRAMSGDPVEMGDSGDKLTIESVADYCNWLISRDSKAKPLKDLEGLIWREGFSNGNLQGEVYRDVPESLVRWQKAGKRIFIYSSGSVLSQRLIFSTTKFGDLTRYIEGYFDTTIGKKTDPESYRRISQTTSIPGDRLLFLSDAEAEIGAAATAGLVTMQVNRNMDSHALVNGENIISDFSQVLTS